MRKRSRTRGFGVRAPVAAKPSRPRWHLALALVIGAGGAAVTAAVSFGAVWAPESSSQLAAAVPDLPPPMPEDTPFDMQASDGAGPRPFSMTAQRNVPSAAAESGVRDIREYRAVGVVALSPYWIFDPVLPGTPTQAERMASATPSAPAIPLSAPPQDVVLAHAAPAKTGAVPLPAADPRGAGAARATAQAPVPAPAPAQLAAQAATPDAAIDAGDVADAAPLPQKNPLGTKLRLASLVTGDSELQSEPVLPPQGAPSVGIPMSSTEVRLPGPSDRFAVYDIVGQVVYMPDGTKFEAHSGYGDKFDNPRHVSVKMLGPTPPNTYRLTMRESLFHGVEALRMNPIGKEPMYGRNGILTHSYLLGARGDSNGCISFKEYEAFLAYFKRGKIDHMVVVARLPDSIKPKGTSSMFAWLKPKSSRSE